MFDQDPPSAVLDAMRPSPHLPQPWETCADDAWLDELVAGDPECRQPPAPAVVVADGESAPVTPALIASLGGVDVDALDDSDLIGLATAWSRVRNYAVAHVADAVAVLAARGEAQERLSVRTQVAAEIGAALRLGDGAADVLVDTATTLAARLQATLQLVRRGDLSWEKAVTLAQRTAMLTDEQAQAVESRVLPRAAERTPARHADAVRRAVDRVDPDGADDRRRKACEDVALIRQHYGDGMGELFARMPSEQLDTVWTAADTWARARKSAGDERTLDQLRVAALVQWAQSFLTHGDPTYCDRWCTDSREQPEPADNVEEQRATPPHRHGKPAAVHVLWDLASLLGLAAHGGELLDSGAMLPPGAMRELVDRGVRIRRMVIDRDTGELVDLSPRTWTLPPTSPGHPSPVVLSVIVDSQTWQALVRGEADVALTAAVAVAPTAVREMLAHPLTADDLDRKPAAYPTPASLAEFVSVRDRHPTQPTGGLSAASAADLDHTVSVRNGGKTVRRNLTPLTRRWHLLRTFGGWTVRRVGRQWLWTSPAGRTYTTEPHDYRLGP